MVLYKKKLPKIIPLDWKYLTQSWFGWIFQGSGGLDSIGVGKGRGYTVNIPLLEGARDEEFVPLVCR